MKLAAAAAVIGIVLVTAGCSGSPTPTRTVQVTATVTATATTTTTDTVTAEPTQAAPASTAPAGPFPPGYPKVVPVGSLPNGISQSVGAQGATQAVAVAPGVWAPLAPGADPTTSATAGVLDGYCASIKAYEQQYLNGQQAGGSCF